MDKCNCSSLGSYIVFIEDDEMSDHTFCRSQFMELLVSFINDIHPILVFSSFHLTAITLTRHLPEGTAVDVKLKCQEEHFLTFSSK